MTIQKRPPCPFLGRMEVDRMVTAHTQSDHRKSRSFLSHTHFGISVAAVQLLFYFAVVSVANGGESVC